MGKYYFFSFATDDGIFSGVNEEHPFACLKNAYKIEGHWELVSWQEISKEEYDLWFEFDLD